MAYPKMKPCPNCRTADYLDVYKYDGGWQHVECDKCYYLGPAAGNIRETIKRHNAHVASEPTALRALHGREG